MTATPSSDSNAAPAQHTSSTSCSPSVRSPLERIAANGPGILFQCCWHPERAVSFPFVSTSASRILGVDPAAFQQDAQHLIALIDSEDRASFNASLQKSIETLQTWEWEGRLELPSGNFQEICLSAEPEPQLDGEILWDGLIIATNRPVSVGSPTTFSAKFLTDIFNSIADPIFVKDDKHRWILLNDAACNLVGYSRDELLGKSDYDFSPKEQADVFWEGDEWVLTTGKTDRNEEESTDYQGITRTLSTQKSRLVDARGNRFLVGTIRDISDRTLAQNQLRESQQLLQLVLDNVPQAIFWKDRNFVYLGCNRSFAEDAGLDSPAEIVGKTDRDLPWTPEEVDFYRECDRRVMESERAELHIGETQRQVNGQQAWLDTNKVPLRNAKGEIVGVLGTYEDITERKQAQQTLELMRFSLDRAADAIFWVQQDARFFYANQAACHTLGYSPEELLSMCVFDINVDFPVAAWPAHWQRLKQHGSFSLESQYRRKDGRVFPVEVLANYLEFEGIEYNFVRVRDITARKQAEAERQKFIALIENSTDFIGLASLAGEVLFLNAAGCELVGLENLEAAKAVAVMDFFMAEDVADVESRLLPTLMETGIWHDEYRFRHFQTREAIAVDFNWFALKDPETGEPLCMATISRDIRDRKLTENQLRQSQQFLQLVVDCVPQSIFWKNRDLVYLGCNRNFARDAGMNSPEEILGKTDYDLPWTREEADFFRECDRQVMESNQPQLHIIETQRQADGQQDWLDTSKIPLLDADGNVVGILGTYEDITARVEAEDALRESERRYASLAAAVPVGIFRTDAQGHCIYVNQRWCEMAGLTFEEARGTGWMRAIHPQDCDRVVTQWYRMAQTGEPFQVETRFKTPDNRVTWVFARAVAERDENGKVVRYVGTMTDISDRVGAEEALRESQRRYATLTAAVPVGIFRTDKEGNCLYVNQRWCEIAGLTSEEALGMGWVRAIHPDDGDRVGSEWYRTAEVGEPFRLEYRFQTPDGKVAWVFGQGVVELNENAEMVGFVGTVTDISDRVEAEDALRASERDLRTMFDSAYDSIFVHDLEGNILDVNQKVLEIFSISHEQALSLSVPQISSPDNPIEQLPEMWQQVRDGEKLVFEWIALRPFQRETFDVEVCLQRVTLQAQDVILATVRDVTQRKRAEAKLQEQEQFLRSIYDGVEHLIFVVDRTHDAGFYYSGWNRTTALATGISYAQAIGKTPQELFGEVEGETIHQRYHQCWQSRTAISYEECLTLKGERTWWLTTLNPLTDEEDRVYRLAGTTFNITDRKDAELQLHEKTQDLEKTLQELKNAQIKLVQSEKMSSLGQLVAGVAHEINNPVNFIYGNLTHLKEYAQDLLGLLEIYRKCYPEPVWEVQDEIDAIDLDFLVEDLPKALESMKVGADRIKDIVLSLRTFSRMDEAKMKEVDLHDGIDSTLMILQNRLKAKPDFPEIEVIKNYGNLPLVECYAGQLNQVFMNIVVNAIDALEMEIDRDRTSIPHPHIQIGTQLSQDGWVSISIADNGPGIPDTVKQKLFDPFFTTKPIGKGTGMGLSISYQIITERHGGSLECLSTPGRGTTFSISIPLRQS